MSDYIIIELNKNGKKNANKYKTIVDAIDSDLEQYNWCATEGNTRYAYRKQRVDKKNTTIRIHRVILSRKLGRELLPTEFVDHVNRNGLDNRRDNLRLATPAQNIANRNISSNNKLGIKGVHWRADAKKYRARIMVNRKTIELGYFDTEDEAKEAYRVAALEYYGEYAYNGNKGES